MTNIRICSCLQSNETNSSSWCEYEGLVRVRQFLTEDNPLVIQEITTDRNRQIAAYIRDSMPGTDHYYDVWHVAKGNGAHNNYYYDKNIYL